MPDIADVEGDGGGRSMRPAGRAEGASSALAELFRQHHLELVGLAVLMVGDLATAEDVVQDAFEGLHRGWHGLHQPSSGLAYVRSSVLNRCPARTPQSSRASWRRPPLLRPRRP
jgi:DNA-directed RNA polymerase specialized sigma24 family protein